jgi:hypothetical protein
VLFSDDFEGTLLGQWSGYTIVPSSGTLGVTSNGGSVALTTDEKYTGDQSLQCDWKNGDIALGLKVRTNVGKEIYVRSYIKWETGYEWPSSHKFYIFWGNNRAGGLRLGFYTMSGYGGKKYLSFYAEQPGGQNIQNVFVAYEEASAEHGTDWANMSAPSPYVVWQPETNRWYSIELYIKVHPTEGQLRIWIDGDEKELWSQMMLASWPVWQSSTPWQPINTFVGEHDIDDIDVSSLTNDRATTKKVWFDDFVISTQYIGSTGENVQAPTFSGISVSPSTISRVAGFNTATISFTASEPLAVNPTVAIGDTRQAMLQSQNGLGYVYTYTATGNEAEGAHIVGISGTDTDGNVGENSSGRVIFDFTPPSPPSGIIIP